MAWIRLPGIEGLVYQPESDPSAPRKHDCTDCFVCQMCSDSRCVECRKQRAGDACHPIAKDSQ